MKKINRFFVWYLFATSAFWLIAEMIYLFHAGAGRNIESIMEAIGGMLIFAVPILVSAILLHFIFVKEQPNEKSLTTDVAVMFVLIVSTIGSLSFVYDLLFCMSERCSDWGGISTFVILLSSPLYFLGVFLIVIKLIGNWWRNRAISH